MLRPIILAALLGCAEEETSAPAPLSGTHALSPQKAMLIPCTTPSGTQAALAVVRSERCGDETPRTCRAWRELLQHPFACQPGGAVNPRADAITFWLEGGAPGDLTGAVALQLERHRCGHDTEPLIGEAMVLDAGDHTRVHFDADGLSGDLTFIACL